MAGAIVQPGASIGQQTYCPISGVVFAIKDASAHRLAGDETIYFCCEACAKHFDEHKEKVSVARAFPR